MKKITINIEVNWGSEFQQDWLMGALNILLETWKSVAESKHKQNKITYEIDTHDGYKIRKV
ncbi:MAG: hypothetical protein PHE21_00165 [Candidatus Dojkabacteria bacterium]|nr:hypothetical protein [Candidatus Dojkabacteria bacterium]